MRFAPYSYQAEGVQWIIEHPACALLWDMGLGKTVTTLTAVNKLLYDYVEEGPVLVIAPLRVAENTWATEAGKWDHTQHLRIRKIMGSREKRVAALQDMTADIYVINRENVVWLVETLMDYPGGWPFPVVVIDELSSFKSPAAKRFKALRRVRGRIKRIIGLTGTPAPNGIADLWSQFYLLDQGVRLGRTLGQFRGRYLVPEKMNGHIVYSYKPRDGAAEEVQAKIKDIATSLKKEDYLQLPGQIYQDIELTLPDATMRKYRKFERDSVMDVTDAEGDIVALNAASLTGKLLQFANGAVYTDESAVQHVHDIKLDALEELIEAANGESVLVFYSFKHDRDRIIQRIDCRELRTAQDITDWNVKKIPVAIAHPASVGHGLNLQAGGHIIVWFGLTWSWELYAQANERLNRPGQTQLCLIYHLIAKGTVDELVLDALKRKESVNDRLIEALKQRIDGR